MGHGHAGPVQALIEPTRILHAHRHLGEQRLQHPRRRQEVGRTHLPHIGQHGLGRFGTANAIADDHGLDVTEQILADPARRQVSHGHVGVFQTLRRRGDPGAIDQRPMGKNDAFGRAGRARGEEQEGRVLPGAARGLGLQETALRGGEFPALLQQGVVADKLRPVVVAHAPVLVVDDAANRWAPRQDLEQLVDLLLVLGEDVADFRALNRRRHLIGRRILIERHRDGAQPVRRAHRCVEARPIVAHERDMRPALQTARRQCGRQRGCLVGQFAPRHGAPDAALFLP